MRGGVAVWARVLTSIALFGCDQRQAPQPAPAPVASSAGPVDSALPAASADPRADSLAKRFCETIHAIPEQRKRACCDGAASAGDITLVDTCVSLLARALDAHAVTLAAADVDACADAMEKETAGCDWVTPGARILPAVCEGILHGALGKEAPCGSSLECLPELHCEGLTAYGVGKCEPPKPAHARCDEDVDLLTGFAVQERAHRAHPECAGYCRDRRCVDAVSPNAPCTHDRVCGRGRCENGACTNAPLPPIGEPCTRACANGGVCRNGRCVAPKKEGEVCAHDDECRGRCVHADAGMNGTCSRVCR